MRWNFAIAVVVGFVLAMALAFGGGIVNGPRVVSPPSQSSN
jgi:hypothetical protein